MGAAKESPATQVLTWAVGKLDEASKIDWVEKISTLTASKPAYLRNGLLTPAAPSMPAPAPAGGGGADQAELDRAQVRAAQAEARAAQAEALADSLARQVAVLQEQLAGRSGPADVELPADDAEGAEDDDHKSHWWSRHC